MVGVPLVQFGRVARFSGAGFQTEEKLEIPFSAGHMLVAGSTRSGKSSAVASFLSGLPQEARCWVFDPENDPVYLNLAVSSADSFYVLDARDLKRNILEPPPGCSADTWLNQVKRNLRESCFLRDGSVAMLSVLLDHCRKARPGGQIALRHVYQSLVDLRYRLIQAGREYTFYETLKNRLESLLLNQMYACVKGFDLSHLAKKNVLFLCASLGSDEYPLFVNDMLSWLSCHFQPSLDPVPKLVVVLEEVHRLTNYQRLRRADIAEPIVLDAVRTLAKRRVSLLIVDQVPSELPTQVLANTGFRAVFQTIEGRDLDALQRSMSLTDEQRAFVSRLPRRVCVVHYGNPRFPEPFCVRIEDIDLRADIDDDVLRRKAHTLEQLSFTPLEDVVQSRGLASPKPEQAGPLVSKPALDYLTEISKNQFLPASKRDQQLGIPLSQGNALRRELESAGLICLERINTYSRARKVLNTRLTDKGYAFLKEMKVSCDRPRGKGSWEHVFHQHSIAEWGSRTGWQASVEHFSNGKAVDVCLEKDGKRGAVEILCHGVMKELANLRDLFAGYSEVWFCVPDPAEAGRLRELISLKFGEEAKAILSRVRFKLLGDFQDSLALHRQSRGL